MAVRCEPLCRFSDRLFFTTFPHPPPRQSALNGKDGESLRPEIRDAHLRRGAATTQDPNPKYYYFTIDDQLVYQSFFQDWGPLNLAMVYKCCIYIHQLLLDEELLDYRLVLYSSSDAHLKANAALLMALFALIVQQRAPWDAFQPVAELEFKPFRDAGRGLSDFNLSIQDCLWGVYKAIQNGLCDLAEFDVNEYEYYEKVENGDWNWITPNFIAFASPVDPTWFNAQQEKAERNNTPTANGAVHASPTRASPAKNLALRRKLPAPFQNCLEYFEQHNVKLVVRLNNELYDRQTFLERGMSHLELFFEDGTNPTDEIVRQFIDVSDEAIKAGGVVAVHCKAGLGRTGTLIGAYLIWKYGFTASEAIAFMRIARPGCVVGPQQQFMYSKQLEWAKWAAIDEMRRTAAAAESAPAVVAPVTPPADTVSDVEMQLPPTTTVPTTPMRIPPVTPSKHVAAASAKAKSIAPPGQPRKTPRASQKRAASDSSDEEGGEEADVLPALGVAPPPRKPRAVTKPRGVTESEQRPTRVTRSTAASTSTARKPGTAIATKPTGPNKIPRLAHGTTARTTTSTATAAAAKPPAPVAVAAAKNTFNTAGTTALRRTARVPPPTPSRLPTLAHKRGHGGSITSLAEMVPGSTLKPTQAMAPGNEWMKDSAGAVVKPGTKGERPGLRRERRRRSSFSAADVVA